MSTIPIFILTGFLGSGKTTLLNQLLDDPAFADSAVIINEFGDISVDHDLVRIADTNIVQTSAGCLCCSSSQDLRATLFEIEQAAATGLVKSFARVIVETSGLVDPAPLINQIIPGGAPAAGLRDHVVARKFWLAGVVTTVDIVLGETSIKNHFEAIKQIAFADRIVLTKTDFARDPATKSDIAALRNCLKTFNASAAIVDRHDPGFCIDSLFQPRHYVPASLGDDVEGWLALDAALVAENGHSTSGTKSLDRHGGRIRTFAITRDEPIDPERFRTFLDVLRHSAGPNLLRMKGLVSLDYEPDRPRVVHSVQHVVFPPTVLDAWPGEDRRSRLVFITDGIDEGPVRGLFEAVLDSKSGSVFQAASAGLSALFVKTSEALMRPLRRKTLPTPANRPAAHLRSND